MTTHSPASATTPATIPLTYREQFFLACQRALPRQALTALMGSLANRRAGDLTRLAIELFIKRYGVDMSEAEQENPADYACFNDFFTRPLKAGLRPLANSTWLSPVDGSISQLGGIAGERIFQAKGHDYSLLSLLGGDSQLAHLFKNGSFATLYLSPRDYHRIHMPCAGTLRRMVYVPGDLYSVTPLTAQNIPGLFARNERVVCFFDTAEGPLAMVLVGATIVGSMATVWHGPINAQRGGQIQAWDYDSGQVELQQGQEMGRFMLGSTVVLCWTEQARVQFSQGWEPGRAIRMGQAMAQPAGSQTLHNFPSFSRA